MVPAGALESLSDLDRSADASQTRGPQADLGWSWDGLEATNTAT